MKAAIGYRAHSGWAALVAVAGSSGSLTVVDRRRIELADPDIDGSTQPYHAAEGLELTKAEEIVKRCAEGARHLARQAIRAVLTSLRAHGYETKGCGMLLSSGRQATTLAATLASHALIHTADGELFRDAIVHACERNGLPVTGVKERDIYDTASERLRIPQRQLRERIAELGKSIGAPWREDQKLATLVGWIALVSPIMVREH